MKYCPVCGLESEAKFCSNCGAQMVEKTLCCPNCGAPASGKFCPNCGASLEGAANAAPPPQAAGAYSAPAAPAAPAYNAPAAPTYNAPAAPTAPKNTYHTAAAPTAIPDNYKLGWHKFLIYFSLWCAGILDIVNGARTLLSSIEMSHYYAGIGRTFLFNAVITLALGVFFIFVRFQLANFKRNAPTLLLIANGAAAAASLLHLYIIYRIYGNDARPNPANLIANLVLLVINWLYYSKRKSLFVH